MWNVSSVKQTIEKTTHLLHLQKAPNYEYHSLVQDLNNTLVLLKLPLCKSYKCIHYDQYYGDKRGRYKKIIMIISTCAAAKCVGLAPREWAKLERLPGEWAPLLSASYLK